MAHSDLVREFARDPEGLESAYRSALESGQSAAFGAAIEAEWAREPDNLLLAAWHHRLAAAPARAAGHAVAWEWVIPLAALCGLVLWLLSSPRFDLVPQHPFREERVGMLLPLVFLLAGPVCAAAMMSLATALGTRRWRVPAVLAGLVGCLALYAVWAYPRVLPLDYQGQYLAIAAMGLSVAAWLAVGWVLLAGSRCVADRFAFLTKSLEAFVLGGLFGVAGAILAVLCAALFGALGIVLPDSVVRLFAAGGVGFIAVVAAASVYDPARPASGQAFDEGLAKVTAMLLRVMLPFALVVLVLFLGFLPVNWREPLEDRDVLIVFNAVLFAVMALLVGITPMAARDVDRRTLPWLRRGIVALAVLAVAVGLYSLGAFVYRTSEGHLTPNRLTFMGWNVVGVVVLATLLLRQWRAGSAGWVQAVHRTLAQGVVSYAVWAIALCLALPWLFHVDLGAVSGLPEGIRLLAVERSSPLLLKCDGSDHIYLLEDGARRWIADIPTFESRGFEWHQVNHVDCDDLEQVPLGLPIPSDAGEPPDRGAPPE